MIWTLWCLPFCVMDTLVKCSEMTSAVGKSLERITCMRLLLCTEQLMFLIRKAILVFLCMSCPCVNEMCSWCCGNPLFFKHLMILVASILHFKFAVSFACTIWICFTCICNLFSFLLYFSLSRFCWITHCFWCYRYYIDFHLFRDGVSPFC